METVEVGMVKKYFNAKPSQFMNLGADVQGAARHRNETYENPEVAKAKETAKRTKNNLKALLTEYTAKLNLGLNESTEAGRAVLMEYELKKAVENCEALRGHEITSPSQIRSMYHTAKYGSEERQQFRKAYNTVIRKQNKIRYIRAIELNDYLKPKKRDSFTEFNGVKTEWQTSSKSFDSSRLEKLVKAVQYGNSVPDSERVYVSENLIQSIDILNKYFTFDFKSIGFAFGARGKAGSIAHYQDSAKILQFNRHWDGALIHELGHAIDYALGLPSKTMPLETRKKYREKIGNSQGLSTSYYMKNVEIFARLFEVYCEKHIPELTPFMFTAFNRVTLPDLDLDTETWFVKRISDVMRED